ncbi:MAG TPA: hypothetical protein P5239_06140 [Victivallales bacterium]|nr:hypothetical protein [Victivallales bacterium]HRU01263.1 hypothetical protein [Victivallales bacterium]
MRRQQKFAIGYQEPLNGEDFISIVNDYKENISEVYFAWPGMPSGRPSLKNNTSSKVNHIEKLLYNISEIQKLGVKLNILFNATCYGSKSLSEEFKKEILRITEKVISYIGTLDIMTTSSIAIAWVFKKYFPKVEVRASINMKIGFPESMSYISDLFDSFHLQRDFQRDIAYVKEVKKWCKSQKKKLCILVNSGCLYSCPAQLFHDNIVAHSIEISSKKVIDGFLPDICWCLYKKQKERSKILKSTWIRPEDINNYYGLVDVIKLATRIHSNPRLVINAYSNGYYEGNLLDLFEPTFSLLFLPEIISNSKFPIGWFKKTSTCKHKCYKCNYCDKLFPKLLEKIQ